MAWPLVEEFFAASLLLYSLFDLLKVFAYKYCAIKVIKGKKNTKMRCTFINRKLKMRNNLIYKFCTLLNLVDFNEHLIFFYLLKAFERENRGRLKENETKREREKKREKERERQRETER